ncbi:hypothetical protein N7468_005016 [Penicillium chermesinum]|uniref:Mg2+ transporter protein, CorA-like/Zinc transport protein ZntB n=1 Tax=Penicillium chermesinum TaxID=63820 RepID=A0A9W9TMM0_9EURO|nr:uncharacterized protein N7468_005016 [Penicillium chermesinum]KAJ5232060.1 hypothetical protein N7468_005016 [Penicillium chermesinum]
MNSAPEIKGSLSRAETGDINPKFSRLEASLVQAQVQQRPMSIKQDDVQRHAETGDLAVNELDFNFNLDTDHYPLDDLKSLQQVFDAVQCHMHLENEKNFASETCVECFDCGPSGGEWRNLNEELMASLLKSCSLQCSADPTAAQPAGRRMLVFFIPLVPTGGTSYGAQSLMTQSNAKQLLRSLQVNPLFLLNMIGRPDYWAPRTHWEEDDRGHLVSCDFFCQHPRWNLQSQGSPLSVYMRHDVVRDLTTYVISHKEFDTSINTLKSLLRIALRTAPPARKSALFLDDPFDIHVILSTLSFEASKFHVKRFQRFMWQSINKVDDHLGGLETSDRAKLGNLTKQLQIISQNADSHLANADVSIITAKGIRDAHARLVQSMRRISPFIHRRAEDSINYVISSVEKQKIWFLNYKQRKDSTMSLVFNLVTQDDAANNIQISHDMKQDSTSMNAIAALTMVFLPGTFIATVVDAGIFGAKARSEAWVVWVAVTVPLTLVVMLCWWLYQKSKAPSRAGRTGTQNGDESLLSEKRSMSWPKSPRPRGVFDRLIQWAFTWKVAE